MIWLGAQAEHSASRVKAALAGVAVRQAMMRNELQTTGPTDALDGALTRLHQSDGRLLTVMERERVVGILTVENIAELLALEAAGRQMEARWTEPRT